jgi:hypothetical protein
VNGGCSYFFYSVYHDNDGWTFSRVNCQLVEMEYLVSVLYHYSIVYFGVFIFYRQISFDISSPSVLFYSIAMVSGCWEGFLIWHYYWESILCARIFLPVAFMRHLWIIFIFPLHPRCRNCDVLSVRGGKWVARGFWAC